MKQTLVIILALLLAGNALGEVSGIAEKIAITESPYELSFTVTNETDAKKPLLVLVNVPGKSEVLKYPEEIGAFASQKITAKIFPSVQLEGSTYTGTVNVNIGGQITQKKITIQYFASDNCTVFSSAQFREGKIALTLDNNSYKPKKIEFVRAEKLPADWQVSPKTIDLGAFEKRQTVLDTKTGSDFNGTAELILKCHGKEIVQKVQVSHKNPAGPATGLASLSFPKLEFPNFDLPLLLDVFLAIVAGILLIAFIARLVKFLNTEAKK